MLNVYIFHQTASSDVDWSCRLECTWDKNPYIWVFSLWHWRFYERELHVQNFQVYGSNSGKGVAATYHQDNCFFIVSTNISLPSFLLPGQKKIQLYFLHCLLCDILVGLGVRKLDKYIFHHLTHRGEQYSGLEQIWEKQSEYFMVEERPVLVLCCHDCTIVTYKPYNWPGFALISFISSYLCNLSIFSHIQCQSALSLISLKKKYEYIVQWMRLCVYRLWMALLWE